MNVVRLKPRRLPWHRRAGAWLRKHKLSRRDRMGWLAVAAIIVAIAEDARGHTDKAIYILCIGILLFLLAKDERR